MKKEQINRRQFIKGTATVAGAATPHLAQSTDFSAAKKKKEQYMRAVPSK